MDENYIPHQNLEDPSNIIFNSKKTANSILNNNNAFEDLKQRIKIQNDYIKDIKNEIENSSDEINNIRNNNIGSDAENIKLTIYQKLAIASSQLLKANEQINFLTQENLSLKNIILNKDKIISDFEELSLKSKEKFERLERINNNLKKQLQAGNLGAQKNIDENNNILKTNYNYKKGNNIDDRINEIYDNNINYDLNNYKNIEDKNMDINDNYNYNKSLQLKNNELILTIDNIKKDLEYIENDFQIKLREKDCYIEQLNCELINVYKEYVKLSEILEEYEERILKSMGATPTI